MQSVIIMADLRESSPSRNRALALYRALDVHPETRPHFYAFHDSRQHMEGFRSTDSIHLTRDAIIVMFREFREFYRIDSTNVVVYVASEPKIDQFMTFVLPRVDRVVAYDYHSAYFLCSALRQVGLQTPVHRITPWIDAEGLPRRVYGDRLRIAIRGDNNLIFGLIRNGGDYDVTLQGKGPAANGWKLADDLMIVDHDIYIHFDGSPEHVQMAMASGVVPVVLNKSPYNEWIVNGLNGFVVATERELVEAVDLLIRKDQLRVYQEIAMRGSQSIMSPSAWVNMFLTVVRGTGVENLNNDDLFRPFEPTNRKWIVPKTALEAGKEISIPRRFDANAFKTVKIGDIEEILKFFVTQRFKEVYVFGWDYGSPEDKGKIERVSSLVRSMGKRAMDIFWVSDQPFPKAWAPVFSRMTRLAARDGLNRVSSSQ
jgi:hypothetical protein